MKSKLITAYKDNHEDLLNAKESGDYEEELLCKGYEQAMDFVLSLLGISTDDFMQDMEVAQ